MVRSFTDVIGFWESPDELANAVGAKIETARKWRQRDKIPAEWWGAVVEAARSTKAGHDLTTDDLARIAARKREAEPKQIEAAE